MTYIVKINAQQRGTYITLDQTREIVLLDSNRIVIKQTDFKKNFEEVIITGTFRRKLFKLIVHPKSVTINNEIDLQNKPFEIVYKLKSVTGQKFMIKRLDLDEDYQIYYLKNSLHLGIE